MGKKLFNCDFCGNPIMRLDTKTGLHFCNTDCKGAWQRLQRENLGYTKEWLIEEYINKGRSADDIAREIGRDPKRVWEWIKNYGIETRPRGSDYGNGFKPGGISPFKGHKHTEENKEKFRQLRLKDGRVPCYVNGVHWLYHYKDRHPASYKGGISPERQKWHGIKEWKDIVAQVRFRDNDTCQLCGIHHSDSKYKRNYDIHHIVNFEVESMRYDINNLVLLCKKCHTFVHSKKNINGVFLKDGC